MVSETNPFDIMKASEQYFHLPLGSVSKKSNRKTTVAARSVAVFVVRELTNISLEEIAEYFEQDSSSIRYTCKKIVKLLEKDRQNYVAQATINITNKFKGENHGTNRKSA